MNDDKVIKGHFMDENERLQKIQREKYIESSKQKCFAECFDVAVKFDNKSFSNFQISSENQRAFDMASHWHSLDKGIFIYGPTGCGKTHLLVSIAKDIIDQMLFEKDSYYPRKGLIRFVKINRFLSSIFSLQFSEKEREIESLESASFLAFDDFGLDKNTDYLETLIERILDFRFEHELPTFFSSNFPEKVIKEMFSPRIYSRLSGLVDFVKIGGKDKRTNSSPEGS